MRPRIVLMVCRYASLRDDRQMALRRASHVQRQKEAIRKPLPAANGTTPLSSQAEVLCAGAVFLVALVVYSWTLAPTVTLTDSGELILAAYGLGVAHPPVFPCGSCSRIWRRLCQSEALLCESISRPRFSLPSPAQRSLSLSPNCLLLLLILPRLAEGTRLRGRAAILTVQTLKFF